TGREGLFTPRGSRTTLYAPCHTKKRPQRPYQASEGDCARKPAPAVLCLSADGEHALEVEFRKDLEGDQRFGAGDTLDGEDLVGDQIGDSLVGLNPQDRDEVVAARDGEHFGDAVEIEELLSHRADGGPLDVDQHDCGNHSQPSSPAVE